MRGTYPKYMITAVMHLVSQGHRSSPLVWQVQGTNLDRQSRRIPALRRRRAPAAAGWGGPVGSVAMRGPVTCAHAAGQAPGPERRRPLTADGGMWAETRTLAPTPDPGRLTVGTAPVRPASYGRLVPSFFPPRHAKTRADRFRVYSGASDKRPRAAACRRLGQHNGL
jgi:hypothetical protein